MANYYGVTRTNYVRLKDELAYEQFAQVVALLGGDTEERTKDGVRTIAAFGNEEDGGFASSVDAEELVESGYVSRNPDSVLNATLAEYSADENGERELDEVDFNDDIQFELYPLLAEGEVLVTQSSGAEKQRYVCGYAEAISWTGECVAVNINDIYKKAKEAFKLDKEPSSASY